MKITVKTADGKTQFEVDDQLPKWQQRQIAVQSLEDLLDEIFKDD